MVLIGISGKKRSGKNTIASQIKALTNQSVEEYAFADELKVAVARMLVVPLRELESNKDLYRPMLQAYGQYAREKFGENYWIELVFRKIVKSKADVVVITDVRHINEAESIRQSFGILVRVFNKFVHDDKHISETALDEYKRFNYQFDNTGSLEQLLQQTKTMCKNIGVIVK